MTTLVRIRKLRLEAKVVRGRASILRGVDLDIGRGRIVGLVGESGSGKSTLALALLGLFPDNIISCSGSIEMAGVDLTALSQQAFGAWRGLRIAMIFQDPAASLNPVFRVGTFMLDVVRRRHPLVSRAIALEYAEEALRQVDIDDPVLCLRAFPHELSIGMRQRVMIATALLVRPELLVLDEPTAALDATVEAGIALLFQRKRDDLGDSILFISHNLRLMSNLCDSIAVMYGGVIVESGPTREICGHPRHPYTRALVACEPDAVTSGRFVTIPGDVVDPVDTVGGCVFATRCTLVEAKCFVDAQELRAVRADWRVACWKMQ